MNCPTCGLNLQGVTAATCPRCGQAIAPASPYSQPPAGTRPRRLDTTLPERWAISSRDTSSPQGMVNLPDMVNPGMVSRPDMGCLSRLHLRPRRSAEGLVEGCGSLSCSSCSLASAPAC